MGNNNTFEVYLKREGNNKNAAFFDEADDLQEIKQQIFNRNRSLITPKRLKKEDAKTIDVWMPDGTMMVDLTKTIKEYGLKVKDVLVYKINKPIAYE